MWSVRQPDGTVGTGWALMPLRLFLGATFLFAGLQKLADPRFFENSSPTSIHAQLAGSARSSPIHGLVGHLVPVADGVGLVISLGEVAIGLGILVGLLMRVAAVAGMVLSFGLFLTVSFHSSPYFTGSDIVFLFAWTPIALAGAAGAPAIDTWLAGQQAPASPRAGGVSRRAVLSKGAVAGAAAGVVLVGGGLVALLGRAVGGTSASATGPAPLSGGGGASTTTVPSTTSSPSTGPTGVTTTSSAPATATTAAPPSGTAIGHSSDVPVGGSASFTDPASGDPALVIQQTSGEFVAFDAVCPHAGCTVAYASSAKIIACPCHGSEFNARTGAVLQGPASSGLTAIRVIRGANGDLYVPS
jgi:thiosulfate dehydrogenase [quinone] large subunit